MAWCLYCSESGHDEEAMQEMKASVGLHAEERARWPAAIIGRHVRPGLACCVRQLLFVFA